MNEQKEYFKIRAGGREISEEEADILAGLGNHRAKRKIERQLKMHKKRKAQKGGWKGENCH